MEEDCLDEETILAFCRGGLAPAVKAKAQKHIAACDECRSLVSAVMRSSLSDGAPLPDLGHAPTTPVGSDPPPRGAQSAPVNAGDVLAGKFEVERVLGAGGMGVVVAARHLQLGQRVALKFLLPVACEVPGAVSRFLNEGKAAARITSEHVARVVDTGVLDGGAPYLVMEYLEGSDLAAVLAERGQLPVAEALEYVLQACEAIVEAHTMGIVHRDLKPSNLFLTRRADGSALVKVLDFGISKIENGSRRDVTSTQTMMGSPRYMSPEQMISAKEVDARTDVWALGVILYELVTGAPVFQADTVQGLCALIATAPAPMLRSKVPSAPLVLQEVIAKCLNKTREARIQSVADIALALAPIAPPTARTSIDRIVRVAGRKTAEGETRSDNARRTVGVLAMVVLGLIVTGILVNFTRPPIVSTAAPARESAPVPSAAPAPPSAAASMTTERAPAVSVTPPSPAAQRTTGRGRSPALATVTAAVSATPPPSAAPSATGTGRALSDRK